MEFEKFNKITRYSQEKCIVTEKIDGTNAQIYITEDCQFFTGSRNRFITPEDDNYNFSKWAYENKEELLKLGSGRHFGEWWGQGIQRGYNLTEKRFSLFNVSRWEKEHPLCCSVVPVLWEGFLHELNIPEIMENLKIKGSSAAPSFMNPEGIVIYCINSKTLYKKTFEKDSGKRSE